jgi:coproporphyrinogen III oxidase
LQGFGTDLYPKFKKNCDEYFFLPHRNETRGVGGIFFDYQLAKSDNPKDLVTYDVFGMVQSCGDAFLKAYVPIAERRMHMPFNDSHKRFQEIRRGRYVEFNLLYDRGTTFGLKTKGRIESILMSLPLHAQWVYDFKPEPNSPEAEIYKYLKPTDWL